MRKGAGLPKRKCLFSCQAGWIPQPLPACPVTRLPGAQHPGHGNSPLRTRLPLRNALHRLRKAPARALATPPTRSGSTPIRIIIARLVRKTAPEAFSSNVLN